MTTTAATSGLNVAGDQSTEYADLIRYVRSAPPMSDGKITLIVTPWQRQEILAALTSRVEL